MPAASDAFKAFAQFQNLEVMEDDALSDDPSEQLILEIQWAAAEKIVRQARLDKMPLIHVGLIKDDGLNACAAVRGSDAFIAINRGTPLLLYDVFLRALSLPNVFLQIGSPTLESGRGHLYRGLPDDYARVRELRGEGKRLDDMVPRDPVRAKYAQRLATIAMAYLVSHEEGHIRRGHSGYYETKRNVRCLNEGREADMGGPTPAIDIQATELDADEHAALISFAAINRFDGDTLVYDDDAVRDWVYAITIFYWLFGINDKHDGSHPLPMVRASVSLAEVRRIVRYTAPQSVSAFDARAVAAIRETNVVLGELLNPDGKDMAALEDQMKKYQSGELMAQVKRAAARWVEMREDVEPFSYERLTSRRRNPEAPSAAPVPSEETDDHA